MSRTHHHSMKWGSRKDKKFDYSSSPGWWIRMFMTRPKRLLNKKLLRNMTDADGTAFPVGSGRPHKYYW